MCPADADIECTEDTSPAAQGIASATDLCTSAVDVTFEDEIEQSNLCPANYVITRTWTAKDDCGNTNECVQIIEVEDTQGPEITCPVDATIECTSDMSTQTTGMASATDNCSSYTIGDDDEITLGNCIGNYTI